MTSIGETPLMDDVGSTAQYTLVACCYERARVNDLVFVKLAIHFAQQA